MSSSSSASKSKKQKRNWLDLPSDVTANILKRIGVVDILENAQKVCTGSCNDQLLSYVANRSRQLRRLEIVLRYGCMLRRISEPLMKFPLLEELNLYSVDISKKDIEIAGRYCPMLKTVKVNQPPSKFFNRHANEVAIAIGENLHELRHLELIGSNMSNIRLQVILDGCLCLETLDLRNCVLIDLKGDIGKRCFKQIKSIKLPNDSLEGSPYSDIYEERLELHDDDYYGHDSPELFDGYISG